MSDLREIVDQIAADLDDIHFNGRPGGWIDNAKRIVEAALLAERLAQAGRDADLALKIGSAIIADAIRASVKPLGDGK